MIRPGVRLDPASHRQCKRTLGDGFFAVDMSPARAYACSFLLTSSQRCCIYYKPVKALRLTA